LPHFSSLFPYSTLFRSLFCNCTVKSSRFIPGAATSIANASLVSFTFTAGSVVPSVFHVLSEESSQSLLKKSSNNEGMAGNKLPRSEEHTSELQSRENLV